MPTDTNEGERALCARHALSEAGDRWALSVAEILAESTGHHFHHGWHIGWAWGADDSRPCFLDILSEHRMTGMDARRVYPDGSSQPMGVPQPFRRVGKTEEEDKRLADEFAERNRRSYAALRERGLLPPFGANLRSQDINEFLQTGGEDS